jgi:hypothetical protein
MDNMFEQVGDAVAVLSDCCRRFRHGGTLIFATPHKRSYIAKLASVTPRFVRKLQGRTPEQLEDTCEIFDRLNSYRDMLRPNAQARLQLIQLQYFVGGP